VVQDPVRIEELFPSAEALFRKPAARVPPAAMPLFAWVVAGALAVLLGRHLLYWADRNI